MSMSISLSMSSSLIWIILVVPCLLDSWISSIHFPQGARMISWKCQSDDGVLHTWNLLVTSHNTYCMETSPFYNLQGIAWPDLSANHPRLMWDPCILSGSTGHFFSFTSINSQNFSCLRAFSPECSASHILLLSLIYHINLLLLSTYHRKWWTSFLWLNGIHTVIAIIIQLEIHLVVFN